MLRRAVLVILRLSSLVFVGYWAQIHYMTICIFWHLLEIEAKWKNKATPLKLKLWRLRNRNLLARIWPGSLLVLVFYLATCGVLKKKRIKLKKKKQKNVSLLIIAVLSTHKRVWCPGVFHESFFFLPTVAWLVYNFKESNDYQKISQSILQF